jgi:hypothetical protein
MNTPGSVLETSHVSFFCAPLSQVKIKRVRIFVLRKSLRSFDFHERSVHLGMTPTTQEIFSRGEQVEVTFGTGARSKTHAGRVTRDQRTMFPGTDWESGTCQVFQPAHEL